MGRRSVRQACREESENRMVREVVGSRKSCWANRAGQFAVFIPSVHFAPNWLVGWLVVVVLVKKENGAITLLIIGDRPTPTPPLNHQQMEYENVKEEQQDDDDASTGIGHQ